MDNGWQRWNVSQRTMGCNPLVESFCIQHHLASHGWATDYTPCSNPERIRRLTYLLRKIMPGFPVRPLPHGKVRRSFFNYLPPECSKRDEWLTQLAAHDEWNIVGPNYYDGQLRLLDSKSVKDSLPSTDILLFNEKSTKILALDHEGMGCWVLGPTPIKWKRLNGSSPPNPCLPKDVSVLDPHEALKCYRRIRLALKKKLSYIPSYRLARSGPSQDWLWNYIPEDYDTTLDERGLAAECFRQSSNVLIWSDNINGLYWINDPSSYNLYSCHNAYYVDWPGRRWLIAVPAEVASLKKRSDIAPSFVPLESFW